MSAKQCKALVVAGILWLCIHPVPVVGTEVEQVFPPIEWTFQGKPIPETHWSPWLPLGMQQGTRLSFGFRFSSGAIGAKCPVKLTFSYDPANAKSGRDLAIKVKAEMQSADYNTFESAFGIALPNRLQIGFVGITALPDFLPWWDLPWDFWDLIGEVPIPEVAGINIPAMLESAKNNIGVNTASTEALPLGRTASYHDQRSLISFDLTGAIEDYKDDLAPDIFNKLSEKLGPDGMDDLLTIVQWSENLGTQEAAVEFVTDLCGDLVGKLAELASLALEGDPYFSIEGVALRAEARCYIPGGKGSGVYPLSFTASGQEQTINFRDITPFVDPGDVLKVVIDKLVYEFRLRQGLTAVIKLSVVPIDLDTVEKVVTYTQAERAFTESDFKLEIPLSKSDDLIQGLRVHPGYVSASVNWASPNVPLKGTVRTYDGNTLIKTTTESEFKNAHNVIVTDLTPNKSYRFAVECLTPTGLTVQGGEKTATTVSSTFDRKDQEQVDILDKYGKTAATFSLTNASATADYAYIDFSWQTSLAGSTMVLISPSPDLAVNYIACAKKTDGSVSQGWVTRDATMSIGTTHQIRITGLEQGVTYYYNVLSWKYTDDDPTKNPIVAVGKVGQIATKFIAPPQARAKVQYQNQPVPDVPVVVSNVDDASFHMTVMTDATGLTPSVTLEKGKRYKFSVKDHPYYVDATSSMVAVGTSASGPLPDAAIALTSRPSPGGYVYDALSRPLAGATVRLVGRSGFQTTTDATGHYTFAGFDFVGPVTVEAGKADYVTKQVAGRVEQHGLVRLFSADHCLLGSAVMNLDVTVKKLDGAPINGMNVAIREGDTQRGTFTTNAQGKGAFSCNFNDNNAGVHTLTVAVQPGASSKVLATSMDVTVIGGERRSVEINCPEDTQGPVVGAPLITRPNSANLQVAVNTSEEAVWSVEYTDPKGARQNTAWTTAYARSGSVSVPLRAGAGVYRLKVRAKDRLNNSSESSEAEYQCFGADQWNLKVAAVDKSTATVTWSKYPTANEFKSYKLSIVELHPVTGGLMSNTTRNVSLADLNAGSHKFDGLRPGMGYEVRIFAEVTVTTLGTGWAAVHLTTKSAPPQIRNVRLTPTVAGLGQTIRLTATVTETDSNVKNIEVLCKDEREKKTIYTQSFGLAVAVPLDYSFSVDKPGRYAIAVVASDETSATEAEAKLTVLAVEQPKIALAALPRSSYIAGETVGMVVSLLNGGKIGGVLGCDVDWGDGQRQRINLGEAAGKEQEGIESKIRIERKDVREFDIAHVYQKGGAFNVSITVSSKLVEERATLVSDPIATGVNVAAFIPPTASVTDVTTDRNANRRTLHVKVQQGSYPITSWTLNYGARAGSQSGGGNVDQDIVHNYAAKGDYEVELTARDSQGTQVKSGVHVRIYNDLPLAVSTDQLQLVQGGVSIEQIKTSDGALSTRPTQESTRSTDQTEKGDSPAGDLGVAELAVIGTAVAGRSATVEVTAQNDSRVDLENVTVVLLAGTQQIGTQRVSLKAGQTAKATFRWKPPKPASYTLRARIDPPAGFKETNTRNNLRSRRVTVK